MRTAILLYVTVAQAIILIGNVPAMAGYGAVAYDQEKRKQGVAWNEDTQQRANEAALRACASDGCKVRFGVAPGKCAAFATPESGAAWGAAVRKTVDDAKFAALKNCQKHAKTGSCRRPIQPDRQRQAAASTSQRRSPVTTKSASRAPHSAQRRSRVPV